MNEKGSVMEMTNRAAAEDLDCQGCFVATREIDLDSTEEFY